MTISVTTEEEEGMKKKFNLFNMEPLCQNKMTYATLERKGDREGVGGGRGGGISWDIGIGTCSLLYIK